MADVKNWAAKIPGILKEAVAVLGQKVAQKVNPPTGGTAASSPFPSAAQEFLLRHKTLLRRFNLDARPKGFFARAEKAFTEQGVTIALWAEHSTPYRTQELAKLDDKEAAAAWLTRVQADLQQKNQHGLHLAEEALKSLIGLALRESEGRWLGGAEQARQQYLSFPASLSAASALSEARQRRQNLQAATTKAKLAFLNERFKRLVKAKLNGRVLFQRYTETLPFLGSQLELALNIERQLEFHDLDILVNTPEGEFAAATESLLGMSKRALVSKLSDQLRELARRIKTLPHIELLNDAEIAATVAPYYGGLNSALKKRRAKSALVAVEERAREAKYQDDVTKLNEHRDAYADVASYYPLARSLKRQLVLFVGPTNSGKTWRALNALAEAGSGAYLAPLRLLALEGQEELEKRGKPTSFLTGEERDLKPDSRFVSSTIEMMNFEAAVEAVVIDEVQMITDERRGWAWLAALVGAPAKQVIMTGSPDCVDVVRDLATYLGEELVVHECQRYNELRVASKPMAIRDVRPGMAVVCFSRRDVLRIKTLIQEHSELKVAVVYGNLSPQVRREEARRFRSGEADILVATDAIAMGLNLPISEVLFYTTEKFNGEEVCELTHSEVRQIAGRAGRYGVANFGVANALDEDSLKLIREAVQSQASALTPPYYVAPGPNHVRIISQVLRTNSLERILTFFNRAIEFSDERFTRSNIDDISYLAPYVDEKLPFLDIAERLTIASAPVGIRNETVVHWFINRMLAAFPDPDYPDEVDDNLEDLFEAASHFERGMARNHLQLRDAEDYLKTLTVYAWLAYRYPKVFTQIDVCEARREAVNAFVERSLKGGDGKHCVSCNTRLPADSNSRRCAECRAQSPRNESNPFRRRHGGQQERDGSGGGRRRRRRRR